MLRRLLSFPREKQLLVFEILFTALIIEVSLHGQNLTQLLKKIRASRLTKQLTPPPDHIHRLVASVQKRLPFPKTCLRHCLVTLTVLRRRGMDLDLKIGVRKDAGSLDAHAWLEQDGEVLFEDTGKCLEFAAFGGSLS